MQEGEYGKIRDAAKEMMDINITGGDSPAKKREMAFYTLKGLLRNDPEYFSSRVNTLSSERRLRERVGEERVRLFTSVTGEKEKEYMEKHDFPPTPPESGVSLSEYELAGILRQVSEFLRLTGESIKKDPRIQETFSKDPESVDDLLQQRAKTWNDFFQPGLLKLSRSESSDRH